ncbi:hypothetical protein, partial [Kosakonia sp. H7A]|uniref:hypothetical protein n=1 Tax=Kosakonia sp. H7A TaxID=2054598 RepID=UPI0013049E98
MLLAMGVALPALDVSWIQAWSTLFGVHYPRNELLGLLLTHAGGYLLLVPIAMALTTPHATRPLRVRVRDIVVALLLAAVPLWMWSPLAGIFLPSALMTLAATALLLLDNWITACNNWNSCRLASRAVLGRPVCICRISPSFKGAA